MGSMMGGVNGTSRKKRHSITHDGGTFYYRRKVNHLTRTVRIVGMLNEHVKTENLLEESPHHIQTLRSRER